MEPDEWKKRLPPQVHEDDVAADRAAGWLMMAARLGAGGLGCGK